MINYVEYKELKITNDFMFTKIFSKPKYAKKLMEIILGMEVDEVIVETQVTLGGLEKSKSIKLDILVRIGNDYYNIEMQNDNNDNIIKRASYYRTLIQNHSLASGKPYEELSVVNVIFICNFDLFKQGLSKYTFGYSCNEDSDLVLPEYGFDMYLTIHRYKKEMNVPLSNLLRYFHTQKPCDEFTNELDEYLKQCLQDELWKDDYMKYGLEMRKLREDSLAEGKMLQSLELAEEMLETGGDLEYVAKIYKLPIECVVALSNGVSIEDIMEEYFEYK